ncbi:peptidoglycan D,D-transpeptidase FtsI family protein [Candidatus Spongiihabitans sp.]|uniref:peptidoglycan D,D-transpeptidase FtsI family protein n=1 Tax=Candidatus Spongiihabitans sp. TaxID=3101308 RepID=UPI003C7BA436
MARNTAIKAPAVLPRYVVLALMISVFAVLALRVVQLHTEENERLRVQGDKRYLRAVNIAPQRGRILDRNGQVLSVSTPMDSVAAEPGIFCKDQSLWRPMLDTIHLSKNKLRQRCAKFAQADFMYIKRQLPPAVVQRVMAMKIPGVEVRREYKRYYPGGPVSAHLIGFTDVDDNGQEGLERAFDTALKGQAGRKRVLQDLAGHHVESVESIQQVRHGQDLVITIDQRVQSQASRYLESAIKQHAAAGGSIVVLGIPSGEIIAMVNSPQFNPNDRSTLTAGVFRNSAVANVLEPGSTAKPFTIAMVLESGEVGVDTMVDTSPGYYQVAGHTIRDVHDYGEISVFDVVVHSSNVGTAKLALAFPFDDLYNTFEEVGFGGRAASLPGEISGVLKKRTRKIEHATLAYGYGFSATLLQLARAYTVFATDGVLLPVTLQPRKPGYRARGKRVFSAQTAASIRAMLEQAATPNGTARKARIPRYRIGGKTGTTLKVIDGSYKHKRYISLFAGLAPITDPQFVMVVAIDDPRGKFYYGGDVAAPVFADLMADLMRLYNVKPDDIEASQITAISKKAHEA